MDSINIQNEINYDDRIDTLAKKFKSDLCSKEFAIKLDNSGIWPCYRNKFNYPKINELPKGML